MMKFNIFKSTLLLLAVLILGGCSTTSIPTYVRDDNPYKQKFYGSFEEILQTAHQTLDKLDWDVSHTSDPAVFERNQIREGSDAKQIVLLTKVRQFPLFFGTRYGRINVFLRETADNAVEVEVRYVTVTAILFKNFYQYKHDVAAKRILKNIEEQLN